MRILVASIILLIGFNAFGQELSSSSANITVEADSSKNEISEKADVAIFSPIKMPEFPGGMKALYTFVANEIVYPDSLRGVDNQGNVITQFVVNTDGSIVDIVVLRGVHPALDAEVIRVISKMPKWIPGEQNGKELRVRYTLPIVFPVRKK